MKNLALIITFLIGLSLAGNAQGIAFQKGTWAEIQAKAKAQNKYIFVDAYTTWCGPCKYLSKKIFTQKKVGDFYNQNFIAFKLDMEKGEGISFKKKYKINSFPTLLYFNPKGELVQRDIGSKGAEKLLAEAKSVLNPENHLSTLKRKYESGNRNPEFLKKYTKVLASSKEYDKMSLVCDAYLATQSKDQWTTPENWSFLDIYLLRTDTKSFAYIMKHRAELEVKLGDKKVSKYLEKVFSSYGLDLVARSNDVQRLEKMKRKLQQYYGSSAPKYIGELEFMFYANKHGWMNVANRKKDKEQFMAYLSKFMKHCDHRKKLRGFATVVLRTFKTPTELNKALSWLDKSIQIKKTVKNTYTKALILYTLGKYSEAHQVAEGSLALAKKQNFNVKRVEKLIDKIKVKL